MTEIFDVEVDRSSLFFKFGHISGHTFDYSSVIYDCIRNPLRWSGPDFYALSNELDCRKIDEYMAEIFDEKLTGDYFKKKIRHISGHPFDYSSVIYYCIRNLLTCS
jgi:hypothetical protein